MNNWFSWFASTPSNVSSYIFVLLAIVIVVWIACAYLAGLLLPFILFRFYRALGHFNRAHERGERYDWLNSTSQRKEPKFTAEGGRND